jgi:hypothetical protein
VLSLIPSAGAGAAGGGTAPVSSRPRVASRLPVTSRLPAVPSLLAAARAGLVEAVGEQLPGDRYAAAHLAALRAAAAVLAARAEPTRPGRRSRPTSAWLLLCAVAPEMHEWAEFFAAGARKRAAAEAGLPRAVTTREADDLVRDAEAFLAVVEEALGLAHQPLLARPLTG